MARRGRLAEPVSGSGSRLSAGERAPILNGFTATERPPTGPRLISSTFTVT
jgi:hypothetical protein